MWYPHWCVDYQKQGDTRCCHEVLSGSFKSSVDWTDCCRSFFGCSEEYSRETYDEYVERRKCLIDGLNRIPGVYSPIPMGAFYTVAKLPVDDSDKFCAWCLSDFEYEGQTVFMAPASGFYTTRDLESMRFVLLTY